MKVDTSGLNGRCFFQVRPKRVVSVRWEDFQIREKVIKPVSKIRHLTFYHKDSNSNQYTYQYRQWIRSGNVTPVSDRFAPCDCRVARIHCPFLTSSSLRSQPILTSWFYFQIGSVAHSSQYDCLFWFSDRFTLCTTGNSILLQFATISTAILLHYRDCIDSQIRF